MAWLLLILGVLTLIGKIVAHFLYERREFTAENTESTEKGN